MKKVNHKERYQLLHDRRRALHELERLRTRITQHENWDDTLQQDATINEALHSHIDSLSCQLCTNACQAQNNVLLCDVRRIYSSLVVLAKVWTNLETNTPLNADLLTQTN